MATKDVMFYLTVVVLLFAFHSVVLSQTKQDEIIPKGFVINNNTQYQQILYLKNGDKGRLVEFKLAPNTWEAYEYATHIQLWTNDVSVERSLENGSRYALYKNSDGHWDVCLEDRKYGLPKPSNAVVACSR